jgi:hypothetical protein
MKLTTTIVGHPLANKISKNSLGTNYHENIFGYTIFEAGGMAITDRYRILYTGEIKGGQFFVPSYPRPDHKLEKGEPIGFEKLLNNLVVTDEITMNADFFNIVSLRLLYNQYFERGEGVNFELTFNQNKMTLEESREGIKRTIEFQGNIKKEIKVYINALYVFEFLESFSKQNADIQICERGDAGNKKVLIFSIGEIKCLISLMV